MKRVRSLFYAALASSQMISAMPVFAAGGAKDEPAAKLITLQSGWTKGCDGEKEGSKQICYTTTAFGFALDIPAITFAAYDVKGGENRIRFFVWNREPSGLSIAHGVKIFTEHGETADAPFIICSQQGCYAETKVQRSFIESMMKSSVIKIGFWKRDRGVEFTPEAIHVNFELPMAGFGEAFNGPPVDPGNTAKNATR